MATGSFVVVNYDNCNGIGNERINRLELQFPNSRFKANAHVLSITYIPKASKQCYPT